MKIDKSTGKIKLLSNYDDKKSYSLQLADEEYFYSTYFLKDNLNSFHIEYIGKAKNWDEYAETTDFRISRTKDILVNLGLNEYNTFPWGKVEYGYDPRNKTPLINIYYQNSSD